MYIYTYIYIYINILGPCPPGAYWEDTSSQKIRCIYGSNYYIDGVKYNIFEQK